MEPWHWCTAWMRSPVNFNLCAIVLCFCAGATRKGGAIWTQRPTRAHGESLHACIWRSREPNYFGARAISCLHEFILIKTPPTLMRKGLEPFLLLFALNSVTNNHNTVARIKLTCSKPFQFYNHLWRACARMCVGGMGGGSSSHRCCVRAFPLFSAWFMPTFPPLQMWKRIKFPAQSWLHNDEQS